MFTVTVEFLIKPEHLESFRAAVLAQAESSLGRERACRRFDVCVDPDDAGRVLLYEIYDDRDAFDHHLATEHFRAFDATVKDWVAGKKVETWNLVHST